jgi:catalase
MKIDQRSPLLELGRELRRISGPAETKSAAIGMEGKRAEITPYQAPIDLSPALTLVGKARPMLKGRKIGALVTDGAGGDRLQALRDALEREGAELAIVFGGVRLKSGKRLATDMALSGDALSVFFDAVAIFASAEGIKPLLKNSAAVDWVRDAFGHLKVIGHTSAAPLFAKASIADDLDEGVIELDARASVGQYIDAAKQQRVWAREARLAESDA